MAFSIFSLFMHCTLSENSVSFLIFIDFLVIQRLQLHWPVYQYLQLRLLLEGYLGKGKTILNRWVGILEYLPYGSMG